MDWTILWWILAGLLVIAGLAGTVVPAIPGVPLVFAGLFFCAWIGQFETISWITVSILGFLTLIAWAVDFIAGALGARYLGASSRAFWGATIGAIAGLFFGLAGIILGPFIGAVIGELSGGSDMVSSGRAGLGAWIGMVVATAVKLGIAFLMIGIVIFQLGFSQAVGVTA
jgi:uncharacterized protein YqgC (DUF456 family)